MVDWSGKVDPGAMEAFDVAVFANDVPIGKLTLDSYRISDNDRRIFVSPKEYVRILEWERREGLKLSAKGRPSMLDGMNRHERRKARKMERVGR